MHSVLQRDESTSFLNVDWSTLPSANRQSTFLDNNDTWLSMPPPDLHTITPLTDDDTLFVSTPQQQHAEYTSTSLICAPPQTAATPPVRHLAVGAACMRCYTSKIKCNGQRPCTACVASHKGDQCTDRVCKRNLKQRPTSPTPSMTSLTTTTSRTQPHKRSTAGVTPLDLSTGVLHTCIAHVNDIKSALQKGTIPLLTFNMVLAHASQALSAAHYNLLMDYIDAAANRVSGSMIARRFVVDYSDSPATARADNPFDPPVATLYMTNTALRSKRHDPLPNTPTMQQYSFGGANGEVEVNGQTCWSMSERPPLHECLQCLSDTPVVTLAQSVSVNVAFERTFGYSQAEVKQSFETIGSAAFWRLLADAQLDDTQSGSESAVTRPQTASFTSTVQALFLRHHQAILHGHLHYAVNVWIRTKFGAHIPALLSVRLHPCPDGMYNGFSYAFTVVPAH